MMRHDSEGHPRLETARRLACYSYRSAIIGSTRVARRAGK
jgi:hypothetical protein